jgi:aerobic carbon-monoxide dehydrogenase medium subunit
MIPAPFDYEAPTSVDEAVQLLGQAVAGGRDVKVLGGGQSLLPVLRLRLAAPELLVDLGRITDLTDIRDDGDAVVIGAMATHDSVIRSDVVRQHALLLALATETVADPQVRHRGTFGGALVHADPAGDLPAPALALDAQFVIAGAGGARRTVAAQDFFEDLFTTAVGEDELLVQVRVPKYTGWGACYEKFNRISQAWAIVGAAVALRVDGGAIAEARVGLTNMGSVPVRAHDVEQALVGMSPTSGSVREACAAAGTGTNPPSDANADADYRRHLAGVLTGRAVLAAAGTA